MKEIRITINSEKKQTTFIYMGELIPSKIKKDFNKELAEQLKNL